MFDSGHEFELITAAVLPEVFNDSGDGAFDSRSDNKGPEPEGVAIGTAFSRTYAFIGLERVGGVMVYDVSDPAAAQFVHYFNNRDAGDRSPEGLVFVSDQDSPIGQPLLIVSNEISGTTTIYTISEVRDTR